MILFLQNRASAFFFFVDSCVIYYNSGDRTRYERPAVGIAGVGGHFGGQRRRSRGASIDIHWKCNHWTHSNARLIKCLLSYLTFDVSKPVFAAWLSSILLACVRCRKIIHFQDFCLHNHDNLTNYYSVDLGSALVWSKYNSNCRLLWFLALSVHFTFTGVVANRFRGSDGRPQFGASQTYE